MTWETGDAYSPLLIKAELYQAFLIWVVFLTIPFIISQQVYVSLMVFTLALKDCLVRVNQSGTGAGGKMEKRAVAVKNWSGTALV